MKSLKLATKTDKDIDILNNDENSANDNSIISIESKYLNLKCQDCADPFQELVNFLPFLHTHIAFHKIHCKKFLDWAEQTNILTNSYRHEIRKITWNIWQTSCQTTNRKKKYRKLPINISLHNTHRATHAQHCCPIGSRPPPWHFYRVGSIYA